MFDSELLRKDPSKISISIQKWVEEGCEHLPYIEVWKTSFPFFTPSLKKNPTLSGKIFCLPLVRGVLSEE